MNSLDQIATFVAVVDAGGFTAAARQLGLPKSTVSRHVAELEERLGIQLLLRTTRSVRPTDLGERFYDEARSGVAAFERAERAAAQARQAPHGTLRVTTIPNATLGIGQLIERYLSLYPDVGVELRADPAVVDLVREGYDVAIRGGRLADSALMTRTLTTMESVLCAAPSYLARRGTPERPAELSEHDCVLLGTQRVERGETWRLTRGRATAEVTVHGRARFNEPSYAVAACRGGHGIAVLPHIAVADDLAQHHLVRVLPEWSAGTLHLQLVFPGSRLLDSKTRAFVDLAVAFFAELDPSR